MDCSVPSCISMSDAVLSQLIGKKIKVYLKKGTPPYRIGILVAFDEREMLLIDNGRHISIKHEDRGEVEEMG